jgi:hypothetical protein
LVYNDAPWMPAAAMDLADEAGGQWHFVHAKISIDVGEKVGLRSLRRLLVLRTSDLMDIGLQVSLSPSISLSHSLALTLSFIPSPARARPLSYTLSHSLFYC